MKLQCIQPHPSIAHYVKDIVVLEDDKLSGNVIIPLIAKGYPSIAFQSTGENKDSLVLYGQNIKPFKFQASDHLTIIAYFLYPHTLKTFFGFSATEVTNLGIDLSLSQPASGLGLKEQLVNASSLNMRLQLMNSYILKLTELICTDINNTILCVTKTIQNNNGLISLRNIQKELHITERSLQRLFESHVGVSPKTFCKICQFNSAFTQINNGEFSRLGDVAYQNGYADQSHLIRTFKEFTHYSPKEYLQRSSEFRD